MAAESEKEKVAIGATEPEVVIIPSYDFVQGEICQRCLLCENTIKFPNCTHYYNTPWVCDECKEAIAFIKNKSKRNPLKPILD